MHTSPFSSTFGWKIGLTNVSCARQSTEIKNEFENEIERPRIKEQKSEIKRIKKEKGDLRKEGREGEMRDRNSKKYLWSVKRVILRENNF